jgi:hypothetical protein
MGKKSNSAATRTSNRQSVGLSLPRDLAAELKTRNRGRQIVGFSLPRDLAAEVKLEAKRRKISLKRLFVEMWAQYENSGKRGV